ncbi:hypothetical protein ACJA88_001363 [Fusarium oxysporum]
MKCTSTAFALLAAAAAGVQAANIQLVGSVLNSAAKEPFEKSKTLVYAGGKTKRDAPKVYEPDPNRDYNLEDGYIFVLQCTTVGFRPECISFGSEPGKCVSYFDFDPKKGDDPTSISDAFNHNVTSISTNTGGVCQFYHYTGCDDKLDDRGLSTSYNYNLNVSLPEDSRTVESHENQVVRESIESRFAASPLHRERNLVHLMFFRMSYWTSYLDTLIHFRFRHVNRRARILASELQEYKRVVKHGMEGFRSILVAFKKLTKVKMKWLTYHIGHVVRMVPGIYSMGEKPARRPGLLLAEVEAARMLSALCLLTPDANEALEMQNEKKNYRFMVSTAYPWYDPNTGQVHSGVSCKGCQIRLEALAVASRDRDGLFSSSGYQSHFET